MKKNKDIKSLNILFIISFLILVTSLIVGTILLCHQNSYCAICFAGTFSSLVLCTSILNECKEVDKSEEEK